MHTHWLIRPFAASILFLAAVTVAHAARVESFPLLLPSTQVYGDCGPVPRCFSQPDDLQPNTAVVGSSGQVSIFVRQATGDWQLAAALLDPFAPEPRPYYNSNFGYLASIDGDLLAVAALPEQNVAPVIYLFARHQAQWTLLQTLELSRSFGAVYLKAIDVHAGVLAVSQIEYATDDSGRAAAKVLLFSRGSQGQFSLQQQLDPARNADAAGGYNLAADHHTLALATPGNGEQPGAVYIYRKNNGAAEHVASQWRLKQVIQPRQLTPGAGFGSALSLSGNTLAIAAPGAINPPPTIFPGAVFVYQENRGGNRWALRERVVDPVTEIDPPDDVYPPPSENPFGTMVAVSGHRLLVKHAIASTNGGWSTAILFERQQGTWQPVARLSDLIVENIFLAGATALLAESPSPSFAPFLNIYELPPLTSVDQQSNAAQ